MTDQHAERVDAEPDDQVDARHDDQVDAGHDGQLDAEHDDQVDAGHDGQLDAENAERDEKLDADLDALDDGSRAIGAGARTPDVARSEALPFVLTAREHFASVGDVEITGEARVDAATARLDEIPDLPTQDHVAVYDDVHRRLQDALSDAEVR